MSENKPPKGPRLSLMQVEHIISLALECITCNFTRKETHEAIEQYLETQNESLTTRMIDNYYYKAKKIFRTPRKEDRKRLRAQSLKSYETLYKKAIAQGDMKTAKQILERLDNLRGIDEREDIERTVNIVFKDAVKDDE